MEFEILNEILTGTVASLFTGGGASGARGGDRTPAYKTSS